jgi:predicted transcriptional regulator
VCFSSQVRSKLHFIRPNLPWGSTYKIGRTKDLEDLFRHRLQPLGVSALQASMLLYLDRNPQGEAIEMASALYIANLSAVDMQRMQKNGWIRRESSSSGGA